MTEFDLGHLRDELRRIEAEVADLRTALAAELRTRRVVVVAADGTERVRLEAADGHGSILALALARSPGSDSTGAELYAVDGLDGDGAEVGLALIVDGDVVRRVHVLTRRDDG